MPVSCAMVLPCASWFFRENKLVGVLRIGSPKGRKKLVEIVKNQQVIETATECEALLVLLERGVLL